MEKLNNIDKIIRDANANKNELNGKKEIPSDIKEHPIDQLDILIAECNLENCKKTIESIKEITGKHPELTGELLEEIKTQKNIANSDKEKSLKIENEETRLRELVKCDSKLRALTELSRAIDRRSKDRDEDEE